MLLFSSGTSLNRNISCKLYCLKQKPNLIYYALENIIRILFVENYGVLSRYLYDLKNLSYIVEYDVIIIYRILIVDFNSCYRLIFIVFLSMNSI